MVFSSMIFLWLFLPLTLILYQLCAVTKNLELKNTLLLLASLLFYSFGDFRYLPLLLVCAGVNYAAGLVMDRRPELKKTALSCAVLLSLGLLAYYKYAGFFVVTVNGIAGRELLPFKEVALPIGISFYTFQALSYTIDLYRGRCDVQKRFDRLLLYVSFFPQLIAGPIVRYRDVAEQIAERRVDAELFASGVRRFVAGLGKKVILANIYAEAADRVFALDSLNRTPAIAWYGILLYALQIYFDFSGYSDMAIGLGRMFGFRFLENFDLPYASKSISEFWRRWHISLSTWFKEYLYIPLGGNRRGLFRTCVNLAVVFLVTGLWHGAGWTFVIWGAIHGAMVILEKLFLGRHLDRSPAVLNHAYVMLVVLVAWVFFRADSASLALQYLGDMFGLAGTTGGEPVYSFFEAFGRRCLVLTVPGIWLSAGGERQARRFFRNTAAGNVLEPLCLTLVLVCAILLLAADTYNPFIYFRF